MTCYVNGKDKDNDNKDTNRDILRQHRMIQECVGEDELSCKGEKMTITMINNNNREKLRKCYS